jgi:hypothetical protein
MSERRRRRRGRTTDVVAIILSASMGAALNLFILASVAEAWANPITLPIGLSDNATQVLTGWGGGIIGVVGALVGMRVGGHRAAEPVEEDDPEDEDESSPTSPAPRSPSE